VVAIYRKVGTSESAYPMTHEEAFVRLKAGRQAQRFIGTLHSEHDIPAPPQPSYAHG
jgi:hypothetical protein